MESISPFELKGRWTSSFKFCEFHLSSLMGSIFTLFLIYRNHRWCNIFKLFHTHSNIRIDVCWIANKKFLSLYFHCISSDIALELHCRGNVFRILQSNNFVVNQIPNKICKKYCPILTIRIRIEKSLIREE
jgi:hypothetical protein